MKRIISLALAFAILLTLAACGGQENPADDEIKPDTGGMALQKIQDFVVYDEEGAYSTFPSLARTQDGNYLLAFRHAPDRRGTHDGLVTHTDPESVTYVVKSTDGCVTWDEPRVIRWLPGCGNQDPVLNVLEDGTVLLTVFFWRFFDGDSRPMLEKVIGGAGEIHDSMGLTTYCAGSYSYVSRDGGDTWEGPHLISENYYIRGKCAQLPPSTQGEAGTVLAPLYGMAPGGGSQAAIFASRDGGVTWEPYAFVAGPQGKSQTAHEPALLRTQSGRIFCFIRTDDGMYACYSDDDGRSFCEPKATGLAANVPYDALQLPSGNVYLAYGHRKEPYGIRALLLDGECNGITPEREVVLRDDGLGSDISYVSSQVLPEGDILTVYYYYTEKSGERRFIAGTIMRETEEGLS